MGATVVLALLVAAAFAAPPEFTVEEKSHWAWQPPRRPVVPTPRGSAAWITNPIDAFVLQRLETSQVEPAAPASREQLLRRLTFDLIGLPPRPEEIDAFLADDSPDAYERVVDRLLASPQYGERWGRHWLDLARYAESNGFEFDEIRPDAWRYRDYVIRAFNEDRPYDRFVQEQLAGDELFPNDPQALVATGFNLLGPDMTDSSDQVQRRLNTLNDMTDTAGLVFLGMTIGCCRCHDHKFEPLPQRDYYRLQAFFAPAAFRKDLPIADPAERAAFDSALAEYERLITPTKETMERLEAPYRRRIYEKKLANLAEEARIAHQTPAVERTIAQKELVEKTARLLVVSNPEVVQAMSEADRAEHKRLQVELIRQRTLT
jgi:hypothetical protein